VNNGINVKGGGRVIITNYVKLIVLLLYKNIDNEKY